MKPLYIFWGKVRSGKKRGRNLGFPTANIKLHKMIPEGIYVSVVVIPAKAGIQSRSRVKPGMTKGYPALTFIGAAKTYNEKDYKAEVHILDFNQNIYGKWFSVRLLKKLRENKKFSSEKELILAMGKDLKEAKKYFQLT